MLHNLRTFRKLAGKRTILAPCLKGNAYGHGLIPIAKLFAKSYANWLCVNSIQEAVLLRKAGITTPILVVGHVQNEDLEKVLIYDVRIFLPEFNPAKDTPFKAKYIDEAKRSGKLVLIGKTIVFDYEFFVPYDS